MEIGKVVPILLAGPSRYRATLARASFLIACDEGA